MSTSAVQQMVVEVDGRTEDLQAKIVALQKQVEALGTARGPREAGELVEGLGEKYAMTGRRVAFATEEMARMGEVGGRGLRELIANAGELAFMFGPGGAIAGAIGVGVLAIVNYFERSRKEMEETRRKFEDEIAKMVNAGDVAALKKQAVDIYRGTPAKGFADGLAAAYDEIAKLGGIVNRATGEVVGFDKSVASSALDALAKQAKITEIEKRIAPAIEQFNKLRKAILDVNNTPLTTGGLDATKVTALTPEAAEAAELAQKQLGLELDNTATKEQLAANKARDLAKAQGQDLVLAIESALAAATGQAAAAAAAAIDERATKYQREIILNQELDNATKLRLMHEVELTRELEQAQAAAKPVLDQGSLVLSSIGAPGHTAQGDLTALMAQQQALKAADEAIVQLGGDDKAIKQQLLQIDQKRAEILKGMLATSKDTNISAKQQLQDARDQAIAIQQAVDGALQLAQAFGLVDQKTTNILRSIGQAAANIPTLIGQLETFGQAGGGTAGGVASAALPVVGALATLATSLFASNKAEDQARAKVIEDNSAALRHLSETIKGVTVPPGAHAAAEQAINSLIARGSTAGSQYAFGGIGVKADLSSLTPLQIDKINAAAKDLGITLDGTEASFLQLKAAIDAAEPALIKAYLDEQQREQEDAKVRELRAKGLTAEADAMEFSLKQHREMEDATNNLADDETIAAIKAAQAAEATAFFAQQAEQLFETLQKGVDDFDQIHHVTDPAQQFADHAQAYEKMGGAFAEIFKGFDLSHLSVSDLQEIDKRVQAFFDAVSSNPDAVDRAGLSVDDFKQALLGLDSAITSLIQSIIAGTKQVEDATAGLDDYLDVHQTTGVEAISKTATAYGVDNLTTSYDLTTQQGRDDAIAYLTSLFDTTPASDPMSHKLRSLIDMIRNLPPIDSGAGGAAITAPTPAGASASGAAAFDATTQIRTITVEQGGRIGDTLVAILATIRDLETGLFERLDALFASLAQLVVTPPQLPGLGVGAAGAVTVSLQMNFYGPVGQVDQAAANQFSQAVMDAVNRYLGNDLNWQRRRRGDVIQ